MKEIKMKNVKTGETGEIIEFISSGKFTLAIILTKPSSGTRVIIKEVCVRDLMLEGWEITNGL